MENDDNISDTNIDLKDYLDKIDFTRLGLGEYTLQMAAMIT